MHDIDQSEADLSLTCIDFCRAKLDERPSERRPRKVHYSTGHPIAAREGDWPAEVQRADVTCT